MGLHNFVHKMLLFKDVKPQLGIQPRFLAKYSSAARRVQGFNLNLDFFYGFFSNEIFSNIKNISFNS